MEWENERWILNTAHLNILNWLKKAPLWIFRWIFLGFVPCLFWMFVLMRLFPHRTTVEVIRSWARNLRISSACGFTIGVMGIMGYETVHRFQLFGVQAKLVSWPLDLWTFSTSADCYPWTPPTVTNCQMNFFPAAISWRWHMLPKCSAYLRKVAVGRSISHRL